MAIMVFTKGKQMRLLQYSDLLWFDSSSLNSSLMLRWLWWLCRYIVATLIQLMGVQHSSAETDFHM